MAQCSLNHSQYLYQASAYGFAGEIHRPTHHLIPTQAATVLSANGGRGQQKAEKFNLDGIVSFESAVVEVGGSYDPCHNRYTSFASSIVEKLNILDVVTADRIVSRIAVYSSKDDDPDGDLTSNITGSHFENLKIAGHKVDVKLATNIFHDHDSHSRVATAHKDGTLDRWLLGSKLAELKDSELNELEDEYHALKGMSAVVKRWKKKGAQRTTDHITYSALNHMNIAEHAGEDTELRGFGSIICIPKFGVVRLAELTVQKHSRTLIMLRVDMCSTGTGSTTSGGTTGGGTRPTGGG